MPPPIHAAISSFRVPSWAWLQPGAVFQPEDDAVRVGWFSGRWVEAVLTDYRDDGETLVVRRSGAHGLLARVEVFGGDEAVPLRTIQIGHDADGRTLEVVDSRPTRTVRLSYEYDARGDLDRECREVVDADEEEGPGFSLSATTFRADDGRRRMVEVRDGVGALLEDRLFDAQGRLALVSRFDAEARVTVRERTTRDPLGRVVEQEELHLAFARGSYRGRPTKRRTDVYSYDGRRLVRHLQTVERNAPVLDGDCWATLSEEVVEFAGDPERPVRDRTDYFIDRTDSPDRQVGHQTDITFRYDDQARRVRVETVLRDIATASTETRVVSHVYEAGRRSGTSVGRAPARLVSGGPSRHHVYEYDECGTLVRELLYEDDVLASSLEYRFG